MVPVANLCNGGTSTSPVNIYNATNSPQTFSVTINPGLTNQAFFTTSAPALNDGQCTADGWVAGTAESVAYEIPSGGNFGGYLVMGGLDGTNIASTSHSIAMGSGGNQWYDFNLNLNANDNFDSLKLDYDGTGGTGTNQTQSGFNVVECDSSSGTPVPTGTVLSPYSGSNTSPVTYDTNDPICFQFLPGAWGGGATASQSAS